MIFRPMPYAALSVLLLAQPLFAQPAGGRKKPHDAAAAKEKESPTDDELHAKILAAARSAFVTVHVSFRKDPEEPAESGTRYYGGEEGPEDAARSRVHRLVEDERTLDLPGLWLDARGTVLIQDLGLETKYFEKIEVRAGDGKAYPAILKSVLQRAPGWLLAVQGGEPGAFPAPAFAAADLRPPINLTGVGLEEINGVWSLTAGGVSGPTAPLAGDAAGPAYLALGEGERPFRYSFDPDFPRRPLLLLFDDSAEPVGVALHPFLSLDEKGPVAWQGQALRDDPELAFAALDALGKKLVEAADRQVAEVKLTFRMDTPEDERERRWAPSPFPTASSTFGGGEGEAGREMTDYGVALSPRRFFVATEMNEAIAARIEKIEISLPGRPAPCPAKFVGAYKAFAGFVVETEEAVVSAPPDLVAVDAFPAGRPIPTLRLVKKYGRRKPLLGYARVLSFQRGYQHRLYAVPDPTLAPGTFLFDLEGRPAGFVTRLRREDEKVRALRSSQEHGYYAPDAGLHSEDNRLYLFREVRDALTAPESALDPDIRVKSKFEERRLVWLGVECCPLNKELSKQMGLEGPTKSGQIGLMVVDVYDDSPARRLGLKEGDILLKVQEKGKKDPVELRSSDQEAGFLAFFPGAADSDEEEIWLSEPPWRPQRNALITILTTIGKGKTVVVTCLVDGRELEKDLVLEEGPSDFEGAPRKKHEATGLTVRDLTYEVRKALRLAKEAPGVVVSKVEEGYPAAVVKIHPFDVIQRVEGKDVRDVEGLIGSLRAAQAAGAPSVKVQILRLNRTRFLDLRFEIEKKAEGPEAPGGPPKHE